MGLYQITVESRSDMMHYGYDCCEGQQKPMAYIVGDVGSCERGKVCTQWAILGLEHMPTIMAPTYLFLKTVKLNRAFRKYG